MEAWHLLRWQGGEPEHEFEGEWARALLFGDDLFDQSLLWLEEEDNMMASNYWPLCGMLVNGWHEWQIGRAW